MLFTKSKSIFNEPSNRHGSAGVHWRLYNHIVQDHDYIKPVRLVSARLTPST